VYRTKWNGIIQDQEDRKGHMVRGHKGINRIKRTGGITKIQRIFKFGQVEQAIWDKLGSRVGMI
jgi:hypothetical protein